MASEVAKFHKLVTATGDAGLRQDLYAAVGKLWAQQEAKAERIPVTFPNWATGGTVITSYPVMAGGTNYDGSVFEASNSTKGFNPDFFRPMEVR